MNSDSLLLWGIVSHLIADWLLQNHWMATNKMSLRHPAAWVHSGIHLIAMLLVFPPFAAFLLFIIHLLIDTRIPLAWWRKTFKQTQEGDVALHVAIWGDQVAHIACIAVAALIVGR
jgi:hypothetical protein